VKLSLVALSALALSGCGILQALEGGGGTGGSSASTSSAGGSASAQGIDCGTDPETSATLCLGSTLCPGLLVDNTVFPGCGFRVQGSAVDIECSCSGFLCPLGAATCADAHTKLMNESYGVVCSQLGSGTCAQGRPAPASSSSSGSTCDTTCESECAGEPSCIQLCGC
jgi:hypothetical protein